MTDRQPEGSISRSRVTAVDRHGAAGRAARSLLGIAVLFVSSGCDAADGSGAVGAPMEDVRPDTAGTAGKAESSARRGSPSATAPGVTAGYDWVMRINEEAGASSAILAYEVADTDDQPLHFFCEEGSGRMVAGLNGPEDLRSIILLSGDDPLRLSGKTEVSEFDDLQSFTSQEIAVDSPFVRAFTTGGWLRMTADGVTTGMAATTGGKAAIRSFTKFCAS